MQKDKSNMAGLREEPLFSSWTNINPLTTTVNYRDILMLF